MITPLPDSDHMLFDTIFMREALKQAQRAFDEDEVPVGAVVTFQNKIIAKAYNQVETLKDPTAHAEMVAITQAVSTLSQKWLNECEMYVTLEPCGMCAGALVLARIKRLVIGTSDPKSGACGSVLDIARHDRLNHRIKVEVGFMEEDCSALLRRFFQAKRGR